MKKITKLLAIVLALTLALSAASVAAFAAEPENSIKLSKAYESTYTLIIPDGSFEMYSTTRRVYVGVGLEAFLEYGEELNVSVTSLNDWQLKDLDHPDNDMLVPYRMTLEDRPITNEDNVFMTFTHENNDEKLLYTELILFKASRATYAGAYGDTLTFSVTQQDAE